MYNLPILSELVLLLHWILVTINDFLASLGLGPNWSWGLAIIGLTIIVRLVLFPLTWKQFKSAQQMQVIQPQIKELQKKYKSDRGKLQQETMKLYQEHRVNPFASCLPLLLQLPVFISLYAAIKGLGPLSAPIYQPSVEALNRASFLWIPHLGLPDPYYILLILYVGSQMISTELMLATQSDKTQKMIMRAMPIIFVIFLYRFPAGLFVYWVTTNIWTIGQQLIIRRTMPKPEELAARAKSKPQKRSRFMEAIMSTQSEAVKQREEKMAKKGAADSGAAKQGSVAAGAKKAAPGAKKPPPGKGKRKPGQPQGGKPGQPKSGKPGQAPGAKPKSGSGGQQGKGKHGGQSAAGGSPKAAGDEGANTSADGPTADD
ncbi:MAG: membrane protein insertase YidC [Thermoleophilia bacterium]|nr:membrane protein insertase YidC [Thermoleophilia bacterium]